MGRRRKKLLSKKDKQTIKLISVIVGIMLVTLILENFGMNAVYFAVWCFIAYCIIIFLMKFVPYYVKEKKMKKADIAIIDKMDGAQFEEYLSFFFRFKGYTAVKTKTSGDFGADIVLKKDGRTTVIQAKRYNGKVDLSAVQEVVTSIKMYNAHFAMVITNSYFTKPAIELAKANGVELWDRDRLIHELAKANLHNHKADIPEPEENNPEEAVSTGAKVELTTNP